MLRRLKFLPGPIGDAAGARGYYSSQAVGEGADFCWRPFGVEAVEEGGGEGVAGSHCVGYFYWDSGDFYIFIALQDGAALGSSCDADGLPVIAGGVLTAEGLDGGVGVEML